MAQTICGEAGKPIKTARVEASRAISTYTFAAVEARKLAGDVVPMGASEAGEGKIAFTLRRPIGVIGAISPFNFPCNLVAHKLAPALAAGCPVVLKPASQTPLSALLLAELSEEAGLPPGWLTVLVGPSAEIGDVLVEDERVRMITFTGSSGVGWGIAERAAKKRVRLELGNSTPVVVAADADLDLAASKLAANAFSFAGQSCISVQRIYVERPVLDGFLERFVPKVEALVVGDPADEATDVGPVIDSDARTRISEWVEEAQAAGAKLLVGATDADPLGPIVLAEAPETAQGRLRRGVRPGLRRQCRRLARRRVHASQRNRVRAPGRDLHRLDRDGARGGPGTRLRRRHGQRGSDVPRRPDAVRRRQGLGQHEGRPRLHDPRDDRRAARRPPGLTFPIADEPGIRPR